MNTTAKPKIRRSCDLKAAHLASFPTSSFFNPELMRAYGDTMANFGVRKPRAVIVEGIECRAYELFRRQPVYSPFKGMTLTDSYWFHAGTLALLGNVTPKD